MPTSRVEPRAPVDDHAPSAERSAALAVTPQRIVAWSLGLFVALRGFVVLTADTPTVTPDEFGSWAVARYLAGQEALISLRDMPRYPLVSGAVLMPLARLDLDPVLSYRLALLLLSALTVAAAALVHRAVSLASPDRPELAALAFGTVLLFPATFVTGSFTWAEPTVVLWWAAALWAVARLAWRPSTGSIVAGSALAGLAPFVHGRLSLVPVIWIVALVARRRTATSADDVSPPRRILAGGAAVTLATAAAARILDDAVGAAVWTEPGAAVGGTDAIATGPWWRGLATALVGQGWYLLAATAGLALVGMYALVASARRPDRAGSRLFATVLAAMLASNLAISVLVTAGGLSVLFGGPQVGLDGTRWDHLVYGRYIDGAALVLTVLGLVWCWERRTVSDRRLSARLLAAAAALCAAGALGLGTVLGPRELADSLQLTIAGVSAWGGGPDLHLARWTVVALVAMAAVALAQRHSRAALAAVAATWLVLGVLGAAALTLQTHHDRSQPMLASQVGAPGAQLDTIVVADDAEHTPFMRLGIFAQQRDLTQLGWSFEFDRRTSAAVADDWRRGRSDVGGLILLQGEAPTGDGWTPVATHHDVVIWRR